MAVPRATLKQLRRFSEAFQEARTHGANESNTVMYLVKFFEEVLGYDSLKGQISKELAIRDRFCDIALKPDGIVRVLVEAKAATAIALREKHIEQAENYASRAGIQWALLTNGIEWRLYHLTFAESEGIAHEAAFTLNLIEDLATDPNGVWTKLSLLCPDSVTKGTLDSFWAQKKALRPASVVRVLFAPEVLRRVRRELNRTAPARLDLQDVFNALRDVLSKEALLEAGELRLAGRRRRQGRKETSESGRGVNVSERVSFLVEKTDGGVRVAIKGRPDTEEVIPLLVLQESLNRAAYAYTEKHLGPRETVGNKGGSLSNRLRSVLG